MPVTEVALALAGLQVYDFPPVGHQKDAAGGKYLLSLSRTRRRRKAAPQP